MQSSHQSEKIFSAIPCEILTNPQMFIECCQQGVPGYWIKDISESTEQIELLTCALGVSNDKLNQMCSLAFLGLSDSEKFLDTARLLWKAIKTWESEQLAMQWLHNPVPALCQSKPVDLFDTFEGRRWVSAVLDRIESGEFS